MTGEIIAAGIGLYFLYHVASLFAVFLQIGLAGVEDRARPQPQIQAPDPIAEANERVRLAMRDYMRNQSNA